jgi:hypothetical protein
VKPSIGPRWAAFAVVATLPLAACGGGTVKEKTAEGQVETTTTLKPPKVKVAKNFDDLSKALDISAPEGYMLQPDQVGDTGPSDIVKASRDDGGDDAQDFLARTGFLRGYQRMWSRSESDDFVIYLYQFGDAAGAAEYNKRLTTVETTPAPDVTLAQFLVPSIDGAVGVNTQAKSGVNSSVTFVKGPYSIQVVVSGTSLTGLQSLATALAEEQYSRL